MKLWQLGWCALLVSGGVAAEPLGEQNIQIKQCALFLVEFFCAGLIDNAE